MVGSGKGTGGAAYLQPCQQVPSNEAKGMGWMWLYGQATVVGVRITLPDQSFYRQKRRASSLKHA